MKPYTLSKVFGGKRYRWVTYEDTKVAANKRAKDARDMGFRVRITKEKSPLGKTYYALWQRGKREA